METTKRPLVRRDYTNARFHTLFYFLYIIKMADGSYTVLHLYYLFIRTYYHVSSTLVYSCVLPILYSIHEAYNIISYMVYHIIHNIIYIVVFSFRPYYNPHSPLVLNERFRWPVVLIIMHNIKIHLYGHISAMYNIFHSIKWKQ